MKYLPLFHHFKAIYQFPKPVIFLVKIVANAPLKELKTQFSNYWLCSVLSGYAKHIKQFDMYIQLAV